MARKRPRAVMVVDTQERHHRIEGGFEPLLRWVEEGQRAVHVNVKPRALYI